MTDLLLNDFEAELRATDAQVGLLLDIYRDPDARDTRQLEAGFRERRIAALERLKASLLAELGARDVLPTVIEPEAGGWRVLVDQLRGLVTQQPLAVAIEEESRLLEHCDRLIAAAPADVAADLEGGRDAARRALDELENG